MDDEKLKAALRDWIKAQPLRAFDFDPDDMADDLLFVVKRTERRWHPWMVETETHHGRPDRR